MKHFQILFALAAICLLVVISGCGSKEEAPVEKPETVVEEVVATTTDYAPTAEQIGTEIVCPVCGMKMKVAEDTPALVFDEEVYYFCSAEEKEQFAAAPEGFMKKMEEMLDKTPVGDVVKDTFVEKLKKQIYAV